MVIFIYIFTFYFTYLAVPSLSCSTWGSLIFVAACNIFSCSMWDLVPLSGIKLRASELETQSLSHWTTRKSQQFLFILQKLIILDSYHLLNILAFLIAQLVKNLPAMLEILV